MRNILTFSFLYFFIVFLNAQTPEANELVKIHEVTNTEMFAIANPETGSFVFNTTANKIFVYNGTAWALMESGASVYPGHFIITGAGSQTITGLPFLPSSVVFSAHANIESEMIDDDNGVGNNSNTIVNAFGTMTGYARNDNGTITQQVIYVGGSGTSINDISRYANSTQCIGIRYSNQNGDRIGLTSAILTAFTADGFTITIDNYSDDLLVIFTAHE